MKNGILLVNKPQDFTSHDVVAKMRGILKIKKIGHAGTLDPMATGVLPLFLGPATRACDRLPNQNKAYQATFQLGIETDTQDITGNVVKEKGVTASLSDVTALLPQFRGKIQQIPPMYSAVQINGKRLYELARQGKIVERPARSIEIFKLELLSHEESTNSYTIEVVCSKGTYVRTLCHDIGQALGCGATLTDLTRTMSSGFLLEDCFTFEEVEQYQKKHQLDDILVPIDQAFQAFASVCLTEEQAKHFLNGVPLWLRPLQIKPKNHWLRIYGPDGHFLGIAQANEEKMQLLHQTQFAGEVSY